MFFTVRKYGLFLVFVLIAMVSGVMIGCSDTLTSANSNDSRQIPLLNQENLIKPSELWIITQQSNNRSNLSIEQIKRIIEANAELFTIDGVIDESLLRRFIEENFENVEIITDPSEIDNTLRWTRICCKFDIETGTITVTIIAK